MTIKTLNDRGLTLIEIIVSISIFILVSLAAAEMMVKVFPSKRIIDEQLSSQSETRKVVDEFVNEIRGATYSSIGGYPLAEASSTEIIFYSNLNAGTTRYRIRYFVSSTIMYKGVTEPTGNPLTYNTATEIVTPVLHGIVTVGTVFTYYDQAYTGAESPLSQPVETGLVRMVGIKVTIDKNPTISPTSFTTESKVVIRNLKDN